METFLCIRFLTGNKNNTNRTEPYPLVHPKILTQKSHNDPLATSSISCCPVGLHM